jgi:hypothetical protein
MAKKFSGLNGMSHFFKVQRRKVIFEKVSTTAQQFNMTKAEIPSCRFVWLFVVTSVLFGRAIRQSESGRMTRPSRWICAASPSTLRRRLRPNSAKPRHFLRPPAELFGFYNLVTTSIDEDVIPDRHS